MSLCLIPEIPYTLREGIYHYCLGNDLEIPQKRDFERVSQGISEFYLKICKNFRAIVDGRTRDMALDLTALSFKCSRHK